MIGFICDFHLPSFYGIVHFLQPMEAWIYRHNDGNCNAKLVWQGAFDLHLDFTDHTTPEAKWRTAYANKTTPYFASEPCVIFLSCSTFSCHSLFCFVCNFFAFPSFLPP